LARSSCRPHGWTKGQNPAPGWNQAEDQERAVGDLLARGPLGVGRTQSSLRPRRESRPSRCFNRRSPKQQSLNPACGSCPRCRSSNAGAVALTRGDHGSRRCSHASPRIRVDCIEVEERRLEDRNPSVRICIGRRRTEGDQKQEQPPATGGVRTISASSLARKHPYRSDEDWIFASPHYHGKTPYTYQILFRRHISPVIKKISGINSSKEAPIGWHALRRSLTTLLISNGECEGRTVAASAYNPKNYAGTLRTSGFSRSAGSPQEGRPDDASDEISGATEGENRRCNAATA